MQPESTPGETVTVLQSNRRGRKGHQEWTQLFVTCYHGFDYRTYARLAQQILDKTMKRPSHLVCVHTEERAALGDPGHLHQTKGGRLEKRSTLTDQDPSSDSLWSPNDRNPTSDGSLRCLQDTQRRTISAFSTASKRIADATLRTKTKQTA